MNEDILKIHVRKKGEDGYKIFSVRLKEELLADIDDLAARTGRSRNELIGILLKYAIKRCEVVSDSEK